jgi:hypothetical protein
VDIFLNTTAAPRSHLSAEDAFGQGDSEKGRGQGGIAVIVEMRTYKTKPGCRSQFLEIFRSKSVPAHGKIGIKILGPFLSVEDPDTFFFMRGFPDLASREPMKAKFYEGELWKGELEQVLMPMLEKYLVVVVEDTEGLLHWQ